MKVGLIGCGLMGLRRAAHLGEARLTLCTDLEFGRATALAAEHEGCTALPSWQALMDPKRIEAVLICTPQSEHALIMRAAIEAGLHVLVEKPAARRAAELDGLPEQAARRGVCVRVGFNLRHHRTLQQARALVDSGALGELMLLRARYGHGGRLGYEREWRANPELSGGGELIDQGVHLIDLARWFLGDFADVHGAAENHYWDMPVEDNGFMMLRTPAGKTAFMHASCTEWKNTFCFELFGRAGKLQVDGLGGSYGTERLTWYKNRPQLGPPETSSWEYPMADNSWDVEMAAFAEDIRLKREPSPGLADARAALTVVETIYRNSGRDHRA